MTYSRPGPAKTGLLRRVALRVQTIGTLFKAVWYSPFWWLVPFVGILALFAVVLVVVTAFPAVAPFVYPLF